MPLGSAMRVAIWSAIVELFRVTHNVPEGAGAIGYAALKAHAHEFAGQQVAVVMCGGNLSVEALKKALG